jgi:glyoxylase-like metal-dependent hydrolase (beta-lactamase superfamily II)
MQVQKFTVGSFDTNCYVAFCEHTTDSMIVDPGFSTSIEANRIFSFVESKSSTVKYIVNTHGHPDHVCGNGLCKSRFRVPILIHDGDANMLGERGRQIAEAFGFQRFSPEPDMLVYDGQSICFGKEVLEVIHTPGHSQGSISLLGRSEIFSGDTLFAGSIGRTDLAGGSNSQMISSLKRLKALREDLIIYAGHGPATTVGDEKSTNPFLQF